MQIELIKNIGRNIRKKSHNIGVYLLIYFAFAFSVFTFIPYEIYYGNIEEFHFAPSTFYMPCVLAILCVIFLGMVSLLCNDMVNKIISSVVAGISLAGYVQSMFLNGTMKQLDGIQASWNLRTYGSNLILWIILAFIPIIIVFMARKHWKIIFKLFAVMLIGVQGVALLSLILTTKVPDYNKNMITTKGLYEVSQGDNVIIFCLDKFDQKFAQQMLDEYPDSMEELKGFTYYPNATGKYCYTHIAVPYLLTGESIPEYDPTNEQFCDQIENSEYFNSLVENVGSIGIYTNEFCIRSAMAREKIDNCMPLKYRLQNESIMKACIKASMYRILPFTFKNYFVYEADTFNSAILSEEPGAYDPDTNETDAKMMEELRENGLKINDSYGQSAYRFIHLRGTHGALLLDKDCNYIWWEETDVAQCGAGEMKMIGEYCKQLDQLGLFDNATIIITADHGETRVLTEEDNGDVNVNPIFVYKPKGVPRKEDIKVSLAPVAHEDIFATVLDGYELNRLKYENSIDDIHEGMDRTRYFWWCYQNPEVVDHESCIHVEYAINGDAREPSSWEKTGKMVYPNTK